jgi:hypothetical protein
VSNRVDSKSIDVIVAFYAFRPFSRKGGRPSTIMVCQDCKGQGIKLNFKPLGSTAMRTVRVGYLAYKCCTMLHFAKAQRDFSFTYCLYHGSSLNALNCLLYPRQWRRYVHPTDGSLQKLPGKEDLQPDSGRSRSHYSRRSSGSGIRSRARRCDS